MKYSNINRGKMVRWVFFIILIAGILACTNPYIGRTVTYSHPMVCDCDPLPATCVIEGRYFQTQMRLTSAGKDDTYNVEGSLKYMGGGTWTEFRGARFELLLCKDGVIVEAITFQGGQGSLERGITFQKTFSPENDFDAVILDYNMDVQG